MPPLSKCTLKYMGIRSYDNPTSDDLEALLDKMNHNYVKLQTAGFNLISVRDEDWKLRNISPMFKNDKLYSHEEMNKRIEKAISDIQEILNTYRNYRNWLTELEGEKF